MIVLIKIFSSSDGKNPHWNTHNGGMECENGKTGKIDLFGHRQNNIYSYKRLETLCGYFTENEGGNEMMISWLDYWKRNE